MAKGKFTKKQRKEIYKIAYEEHLSDLKRCEWLDISHVDGMCINIKHALQKLGLIISPNYLIIDWPKDFPEFYALKPGDIRDGQYWWDPCDMQIRKELYEKNLLNL